MGKSFRLPNGYGSIYKLSGNRRRPYAIAKTFGWDDNGKQIKKIIGYAETKTEALNMLLEYNKNPLIDCDLVRITFIEVFNQWVDMCKKEQSISKSNLSAYQSICSNYCKPIFDIKIRDLKTPLFQNCIDLCNKGFNTKRYIKLIASQVFNYCNNQLDMNLLKNWSMGLKIGSNCKSDIHKPFEYDEIKILWDNLNVPFVDSILISIYTGMRPSEMLKIEIKNVFIEQRYMVGGIKTKAGIDRIIPIHNDLVPIISNLLKRNKNFLIELNDKKIQYRRYLDIYKDILNKLNLDHKPHDGRHTLATELDNQHANDLCVKIILGHAVDDITKGVYTHKKVNQLIETINLAYKNIC